MVAPARSRPVRVRDVLIAALPDLRLHMLQDGIRRDWSSIVGPEISRRSRPGGLRQGVLDVAVDNSPWLHELTLRSGSVLAALQTRYGSAVTSLRFTLGSVAADPSPAPPRRRRPEPRTELGPVETRLVESMVAPVADPELAISIRRLVTKDLLARPPSSPGRHQADPQPSERGNS
jgi:hypothetical protein